VKVGCVAAHSSLSRGLPFERGLILTPDVRSWQGGSLRRAAGLKEGRRMKYVMSVLKSDES